MELTLIIAAIVFSILLLLLEIFFIPGTTIFGFAGIAIYGGAIICSIIQLSQLEALIIFLSSASVTITLCYLLIRRRTLDHIALKKEISGTITSPTAVPLTPGTIGIAISRLNPIGRAQFGDEEIEAKSISGFIDEGSAIIIIKTNPTNVVVRLNNEINLQNTHL